MEPLACDIGTLFLYFVSHVNITGGGVNVKTMRHIPKWSIMSFAFLAVAGVLIAQVTAQKPPSATSCGTTTPTYGASIPGRMCAWFGLNFKMVKFASWGCTNPENSTILYDCFEVEESCQPLVDPTPPPCPEGICPCPY